MLESSSYHDFNLFYDDAFVDFDVVDINEVKNEITVVVSNLGKLSVETFDLKEDKNNNTYFEYGLYQYRVYVDIVGDLDNGKM